MTTGTQFQTDIDHFMANRIKLTGSQKIDQYLQFAEPVAIGGYGTNVPVTVNTLNDIPASTWVKTGVETDNLQTITAKKTYTQATLTINGDLVSDDIDGTDLSTKYAGALKIDEDAEIAGPNLVFNDQTTLEKEKITGNLPDRYNDALGDFITDVSDFVRSMYTFYVENIVNLIPALDREIKVANNLNLGTLAYIEEVSVPGYLQLEQSVKASQVSSLQLDNNLVSMNYLTMSSDSSCGLTSSSCMCENSLLSSPLPWPTTGSSLTSVDRIFSFALPSGTLTLTSLTDSYSDACKMDSDFSGGLLASIVLHTSESVSEKLRLLSPTVVGTALKPEVSLCMSLKCLQPSLIF